MAKVRLSVSISDSHMGRISDVAAAAERAGMEVEQQLPQIGVLTGTIEQDRLQALQRVPGVQHVEEEREVGIAPPGSRLQ
jgi:hypothetical protein